jgi:cellulose synthase/poly-beta-1,6-N-acetylglucosamine synthase-like glycosyltransferase
MSPTAALLLEILAPGFLVIGVALVVLPWLKPSDERVRAAVVAVVVVLMWRYMCWRWLATLPPFGLTLECVIGCLFAIVETMAMLGTTIGLIGLTRLSDRTPEVERNLGWLNAREPQPLVDVFICTYNEDEAILERTIIGAVAMNYSRFRVWVLDDGRRPWLEAMAGRLGAGYLTRPDNAHAKAGNINNGLRHVAELPEPPDFISILDADFVPGAQFLRRTLSLFRENDVGIVQTPQHFINPDPLQSNLSIAGVWPDEQRYFFDVVLASKDAWGAAFCCGTSSVLRFSQLQKMGGFPTDSVTEDYLVTLKMKQAGFRTVYLNERLSLGLAPEGLKEYITQRSRWALGFMQIFRGQLGPLRPGNGLTIVDRMSLIEAFLYWCGGYSFRLLGIIVPILYLLLDINAVQANVATTLSYYVPHFVASAIATGWMAQSRVMPIMTDVTQLLAASQILQAVAHGLIKPKGQKFKVTAKGGDRSQRMVQWPLLNMFLVYLGLTIAGVLWAFLLQDGTKLRDSSALCLFWSWYNIVVLTIACLVCIEQPRYRSAERLATGDAVLVHGGMGASAHRLLDISLGGARLDGAYGGEEGDWVVVDFAGLQLPATVLRCAPDEFALRFDDVGAARTELIKLVYSGRYSSSVPRIEPARVAAAVLERVMR